MKTIQVDTPSVPEMDISVLHMEAKAIEPVEQMRGNQYDLVSDILEELLGNLWEDIDTLDKQSEEEDPCVPEIEKDQTFVHQFEKVEVDEVDNPNDMGGEENSPAKYMEKTVEDSNKREKRPNYLGSNFQHELLREL